MKSIDFPSQITQHYKFLYEDYNFLKESEKYYPEVFGNWIVVLVSRTCRIRFVLDRGQVLIGFCQSEIDGDWHDLLLIAKFLEHLYNLQLTDKSDLIYEIPNEPLNSSSIGKQLSKLSIILSKYIEQIIQLFNPVFYKDIHKSLVEYKQELVRSWLY